MKRTETDLAQGLQRNDVDRPDELRRYAPELSRYSAGYSLSFFRMC